MSDLKLIMTYGGAVRRFAVSPIPDHSDQLNAAKDTLLRHCEANAKRIAELEAEVARLRVDSANKARDYEHEKQIVSNIWTLLGNPSYESLKGRTIYDLIAEKDMRNKVLEEAMRAVFGVIAAYGSKAEYNDFKEVLDAAKEQS